MCSVQYISSLCLIRFQILEVPAVDAVQKRALVEGNGDACGGRSGSGSGRIGGSVSSGKTPSSPALSRISAGLCDDDGNCNNVRMAAEEKQRPGGRRYEDAQRHHGLPDAIEDAVYRSLQTKRDKHPGLGLNGCWPKCSAVAYKSFNDPGPTQCSKLRVYRPKTSSSSSSLAAGQDGSTFQKRHDDPLRPKTCVPIVTAQQLTDIKLALCWDLDAPFDRNRPPRQPDEPAVFHKVQPQHSPRVDGPQPPSGNGKQPPVPPQNSSAVMGFVAAEKGIDDAETEDLPEARRTQTRECLMKNRNLSAVMELIPNKNREDDDRRPAAERNDSRGADGAADRNVSNKPSRASRSLSSSSTVRHRIDENNDANHADGLNKTYDERGADTEPVHGMRTRRRRRLPPRRSSAEFPSDRNRRRDNREPVAATERDHFKSYQQQRHAIRPCLACDNPDCGRQDQAVDECAPYKMAFKAGVPVSTPVKNRAVAAGKPARHLKVPKPRTTNSDKKKYVIGTLLPPFSMWPGTTARDYPEHWRLTSVYRQAFKPLELRKQPLLQTIYL